MTNQTPSSTERFYPAIFGAIVTCACCAACYWAAGASLNFFIGCMMFAAMICPTLAAAAPGLRGSLVVAAVIFFVAAGWWFFVGRLAGVHFSEWISISLILAGSIGLTTVATRLLITWRVIPALAAAIVTIGQLLWLTWPIWLSPSIAGAQLNWSVALHPLMTINGILKELGDWTEQPIAYNLTTLGQDVQFRMPTSAWPVFIAHMIAIALLLLIGRGKRSTNTR